MGCLFYGGCALAVTRIIFPLLPRLTITHKSLELDAVYVGAKTDCSFRYGLNCGRDIPVPIIRARKPFPQALHSTVKSRMRGENPFPTRLCGLAGKSELNKAGLGEVAVRADAVWGNRLGFRRIGRV